MYGQLGPERTTIIEQKTRLNSVINEVPETRYSEEDTADFELSPDRQETLSNSSTNDQDVDQYDYNKVDEIISDIPHVQAYISPKENLSDSMTFTEKRLWELNHIDPYDTEDIYTKGDLGFRQHLTTFAEEDDDQVYV